MENPPAHEPEKDISDATLFCYDNGLFISQAVKLAEKFKKVYYYCPHESAFPTMNLAYIGFGLDNIEVVHDVFFKGWEDVDVWYFPDVYAGALQEHLASMGKNVWGARRGDILELDRQGMKQIQDILGLPVGKYVTIKGIENLRAFLKDNPDRFVKINRWRGIMESFYAADYDEIEPRLDELEYKLGPFKSIIEFIVEENLKDKVEWGYDGYCIDGEFPSKVVSGIEVKDKAYIGVFKDYKDIPEPLIRFNERMKPVFKAYGWRGFVSTEIRIGEDHKPFQIDLCARAGSPPSEIYQNFYSNFAEFIYMGSHGILIDPESDYKYGCEVLIHCSWADKNWCKVSFPEEIADQVKLRNACKIDGNHYCIPQSVGLPEIGAVVGLGDTIDECMESAKKAGQQIKGHYIEVPESAADEAQEQIQKLKDLGLDAF